MMNSLGELALKVNIISFNNGQRSSTPRLLFMSTGDWDTRVLWLNPWTLKFLFITEKYPLDMTSNHACALGIWLCKSVKIKLKYILSQHSKLWSTIQKKSYFRLKTTLRTCSFYYEESSSFWFRDHRNIVAIYLR